MQVFCHREMTRSPSHISFFGFLFAAAPTRKGFAGPCGPDDLFIDRPYSPPPRIATFATFEPLAKIN